MKSELLSAKPCTGLCKRSKIEGILPFAPKNDIKIFGNDSAIDSKIQKRDFLMSVRERFNTLFTGQTCR